MPSPVTPMLIPGAGPQKPAGAAREGAADFLSVLAGAAGGEAARAGKRAPGVDSARSDAAGVKTETPENPDAKLGAALTDQAGSDEAKTKDAMAKEAAGRRDGDGEGAPTDPDITLAQAVTASAPSTVEAGARVDAADPAPAREPKA